MPVNHIAALLVNNGGRATECGDRAILLSFHIITVRRGVTPYQKCQVRHGRSLDVFPLENQYLRCIYTVHLLIREGRKQEMIGIQDIAQVEGRCFAQRMKFL